MVHKMTHNEGLSAFGTVLTYVEQQSEESVMDVLISAMVGSHGKKTSISSQADINDIFVS